MEKTIIKNDELQNYVDSLLDIKISKDELLKFVVQEANNLKVKPGYRILKCTSIKQDFDGSTEFHFNVIKEELYGQL